MNREVHVRFWEGVGVRFSRATQLFTLRVSAKLFRPIFDEIDRVLAAHYGFTDEELDFIPSAQLRAGINYDIKYRMGRDAEDEEE